MFIRHVVNGMWCIFTCSEQPTLWRAVFAYWNPTKLKLVFGSSHEHTGTQADIWQNCLLENFPWSKSNWVLAFLFCSVYFFISIGVCARYCFFTTIIITKSIVSEFVWFTGHTHQHPKVPTFPRHRWENVILRWLALSASWAFAYRKLPNEAFLKSDRWIGIIFNPILLQYFHKLHVIWSYFCSVPSIFEHPPNFPSAWLRSNFPRGRNFSISHICE